MKPTLALKKIIVIGPESTGKSTLSCYLANHYKTPWCPEFAREYLLENGTAYTIDDLITIAKGQLQAQKNGIGRSWGCPAVPEKINKSLIETIKDGSCFFIYAPVYKKESASL